MRVVTCRSSQCRGPLEGFHEAVIEEDEDDTADDSGYSENTESIPHAVKRDQVTSNETTSTSSYTQIHLFHIHMNTLSSR